MGRRECHSQDFNLGLLDFYKLQLQSVGAVAKILSYFF